MKMKRLIITILHIPILTALSSCGMGECNGCGGCDYEPFVEIAEIVKFEEEQDSLILVEFKMKNGGHFILYTWDFEDHVEANFNIKDMKTTKDGYTVSGDVIKKGTCQPFQIQKIELKEKLTPTKPKAK